jgi:phosphoribosylformimino-5-aminoimidazole carboxamide ribotide isomerase
MIIYPAIDMRGGKVVRLQEGDPDRQTTFSDDPVATAQRWIDQGAQWIHMVNLDGAFDQANTNLGVLSAIAALPVRVQFGGGLRSLADMGSAINAGAARIVLGTVAIQQPQLVDQALALYGTDRVCIGLDARDGKVTTHGWSQTNDISPIELGSIMAARGVTHALYTDVNNDGLLSGGSIDATIALGAATGLRVIASGGISSVEEIRRLNESGYVAGAIIGMALYQDKLELRDAIAATRQGES